VAARERLERACLTGTGTVALLDRRKLDKGTVALLTINKFNITISSGIVCNIRIATRYNMTTAA
jgi:hypothetical protein